MNIIIAGTHPLLRLGIENTLTPVIDMVTVEQLDSFESAAQRILSGHLHYDLLIAVDLSSNPLASLSQFSGLSSRTPLVSIIGDHLEDGRRRGLRALGVRAALRAGSTPRDLVEVVRGVLGGKVIANGRATAAPQEGIPGSWERLSRKETEISRLLVLGISNKEIARHQGVQEVTIKYHLSRIFRKLSVRNRTQAVTMLLQEREGGS